MCLTYRSQPVCVECVFFFCITSKSLTLLHIHTLYCILLHLLLIVIITTITIALVLKNKVFFLVWHREFRNWHQDEPWDESCHGDLVLWNAEYGTRRVVSEWEGEKCDVLR